MEKDPFPKPKIKIKTESVAKRRYRKNRRNSIALASICILLMAIVSGIFGTKEGMDAKRKSERVLTQLKTYNDNMIVSSQIDGKYYKVGELKEQVSSEPKKIFIATFLTSAIWILLFFWSFKSPIAAPTIALCIFLGSLVVNAIADPTTLIHGWILGILLKLLVISVLLSGIRSAVAERKLRASEKLEEMKAVA